MWSSDLANFTVCGDKRKPFLIIILVSPYSARYILIMHGSQQPFCHKDKGTSEDQAKIPIGSLWPIIAEEYIYIVL